MDKWDELAKHLVSTYSISSSDVKSVIRDCCAEWEKQQPTESRAEIEAIVELNHAQWQALENVRLLAARYRNEEWANHMLRFCAIAEVTVNAIHRSQCASKPTATNFEQVRASKDSSSNINQSSEQGKVEQDAARIDTPGEMDAAFEHWYRTKFKPAMERGQFDKYVARQAWFAAMLNDAKEGKR